MIVVLHVSTEPRMAIFMFRVRKRNVRKTLRETTCKTISAETYIRKLVKTKKQNQIKSLFSYFVFSRSSSCVDSRCDRTPPMSCRSRTPGARSPDPFPATCRKSNRGDRGLRRRPRTRNTGVRPTTVNPAIRITW